MLNRQLIALTVLVFIGSLLYSQNTKVTLNSVDVTLPGPGKWRQTAKNETGGQWTFENENSKMAISLSARQKTKFEFYKEGLSDFEIVAAFYKWDADYWASDNKNEVIQIKADKDKKYIMWRLETPQGTNIILNGLKADHLIGIQIPDNNKLDDDKKVKYLEAIFLN